MPTEPDPYEPVVLVHKDLPDQTYTTSNPDLVETLAASGWKKQSKAAAAKTEEK